MIDLAIVVVMTGLVLVAGLLAVGAVCALAGVPAGVQFGGRPETWTAVLAFCVVGLIVVPVFARFCRWRVFEMLERARSASRPGGADEGKVLL